MSEAEFISPLRVQLLVGSWEGEVFVCPKNSYPEERIIKAVFPKWLLARVTVDRGFNLWDYLISCFRNKMVAIDAFIVHILWTFSCFI